MKHSEVSVNSFDQEPINIPEIKFNFSHLMSLKSLTRAQVLGLVDRQTVAESSEQPKH